MSQARGLGRRERVAGKRHFRGEIFIGGSGPDSGTYKLGRKKLRTLLTRSLLSSGGTSRNDREVSEGVRVAEIEQREPARTGAPIVGPELVSNLTRSK